MNILGTAYDDNFVLSDGNDLCYGFSGNDRIDGGIGDDFILGMSGDDTLISSGGFDVMFGGSGNDDFFVFDGSENVVAHGGRGFDHLYIRADLLAPGEAENLKYAFDGAWFQMADGGVLDLKSIEHVSLLE